jgi:uncharacterized membrane protein
MIMEYPLLVWLHVAFGALWAGGAVTAGFFLIPAVLEAGPAGGAVMAGVVQRKFPIKMIAAGSVVVLTGLRMYMVRFTSGWLLSPEGLALSIGGLLGIGALFIGVFVQKPMIERLAALGAKIAASGAPPTAEQASELAALRARLGRVAKVVAWHIIGSLVLMASHRFAAALAQ